ncbi:unnamed protein product [Allacma fusca]|uniref:Uncharacterized protein n=1 Tax=Allacma fusca TaxID=39272 RepID=A0A8J2K9X6_9HEXA|nr:unnamed protein product [Allacma fusca]
MLMEILDSSLGTDLPIHLLTQEQEEMLLDYSPPVSPKNVETSPSHYEAPTYVSEDFSPEEMEMATITPVDPPTPLIEIPMEETYYSTIERDYVPPEHPLNSLPTSQVKNYAQVPAILSNINDLRLDSPPIISQMDTENSYTPQTSANSILVPQILLTRIDEDPDSPFTPNTPTCSSETTATQDSTNSVSKTPSSSDLPISNPEDSIVPVVISQKPNPPPKINPLMSIVFDRPPTPPISRRPKLEPLMSLKGDDLANFSQDYPRYFPRQGSLRRHHHFHPYYPPSPTRQVRRSTPERPTIRVPRTRNFVRDERNRGGGM